MGSASIGSLGVNVRSRRESDRTRARCNFANAFLTPGNALSFSNNLGARELGLGLPTSLAGFSTSVALRLRAGLASPGMLETSCRYASNFMRGSTAMVPVRFEI